MDELLLEKVELTKNGVQVKSVTNKIYLEVSKAIDEAKEKTGIRM